MVQQELSIDPPRRRSSSVAIIVAGILAITAAFLILPSSRAAKAGRAKQKLAREFPGPKDISAVYSGYLVTAKNDPVTISSGVETQVLVFAPKPGEAISPNTFTQLDFIYSPTMGDPGTAACLLAPDPSMTGWTLFAKVWIARSMYHKRSGFSPSSLAPALLASPATPIKQLADEWSAMPAEIQRKAEDKLAANLVVAQQMKGVHRYFQNGNGTNYEIDISHNMWDFTQTYEDAYPHTKPLPVVP